MSNYYNLTRMKNNIVMFLISIRMIPIQENIKLRGELT